MKDATISLMSEDESGRAMFAASTTHFSAQLHHLPVSPRLAVDRIDEPEKEATVNCLNGGLGLRGGLQQGRG